MGNEFWTVLLAFSIPSAITGLGIWRIQAIVTKSEKRRENVEKCREEHQIILLKSINASITLGEATAIAIKTGECNGEVTNALNCVKTVRDEQREFFQKIGVKNIL